VVLPVQQSEIPDSSARHTLGGYPRFTDAEMARRWEAVTAVMEGAGVDALLVYGADRAGAAVQWLTQWPVTREAALLWAPSCAQASLFVQYANHVDNATRLATNCEVAWGGDSTPSTLGVQLQRLHRGRIRLGVVGPLPASAAPVLEAAASELVFLDGPFQRLRLIKSEEELVWARRGAALTDAALHALAQGGMPGMSEPELGAIVESAYVGVGGTTHIHYFSATAMHEPSMRVPAQWPADRKLRVGDAVSCEVSASWWGYPGQLLRSFTVVQPPTPLYRDLHDVATAAFEAIAAAVKPGASGAELAEAASLITESGFATCDDLVHGFVGGYLPPIVPGGGRTPRHGGFILEEGMTLVVQPNVVTIDGTAGVQTGELLLVTAEGHERLHGFPSGMGVLGN
jgi:Xaa-Pro dipeptidase